MGNANVEEGGGEGRESQRACSKSQNDNKSWEMQMWKKEGERGGKASAHNKQLMKIIQKQIFM